MLYSDMKKCLKRAGDMNVHKVVNIIASHDEEMAGAFGSLRPVFSSLCQIRKDSVYI